jgi:error-prone DNA polymerase
LHEVSGGENGAVHGAAAAWFDAGIAARTHAGGRPDPRELPPKGLRTRDIYTPDLHIDTIKLKSRNFH